jgi:hypothetical protein
MSGILLVSVGNSYGTLPVNTVAPAVTGSASVGATLTTTNGTWTGIPTPTFSYQWQRNTSNISAATSSTYVVQATDIGASLRCVVTATNSSGAVSANSNAIAIPLPAIGEAYGGGFYAGQISTAGNSVADYNLVVAAASAGISSVLQWKTADTTTAGTDSVIDGPSNSSTMNNASHPAAQFCETLNTGGKTDWYLPAKNELEVCYYNLKPGSTSNNTGFGTNANSVPARSSNYTSAVPGQTSATDFQSGNAETYGNFRYWSSTQVSNPNASCQYFFVGVQYSITKTTSYRARAIRRVAV